MAWTYEEKAFCVEAYFETKSIVAVQAQFRRRYQCRLCPRHKCIYEWFKNFRTHWAILNLNAKGNRETHSGRPKTSRTPENIAAARDSVVRSPSKSLRLRSQELGIDGESVRGILITDLHLCPYQIQIKHKLTPDDMRKRVTMCEWFCGKIDEDPGFWIMCGFSTKPISFSQDM